PARRKRPVRLRRFRPPPRRHDHCGPRERGALRPRRQGLPEGDRLAPAASPGRLKASPVITRAFRLETSNEGRRCPRMRDFQGPDRGLTLSNAGVNQFGTAARRRAPGTPYLVLGVSLLVTLAATWYVADTVHTAERLGFESLLQQTRAEIEERMEIYVAFLRATRSLFGAAELVTSQDFRAFVNPAELQGTYPGIQ